MNPQKIRLAQLLERRRIQENIERMKKEKEKPKKKSESHQKLIFKASAEAILPVQEEPTEFTAEEIDDEDLLRNVKDDQVRDMMIENNKLEKYLKTLQDNEKKLKLLEEAVVKWFDRYEEALKGFEEQMNFYDQGREDNMQQLLLEVDPLIFAWTTAEKRLGSMKEIKGYGLFQISNSSSIYEHALHYGIACARKILYMFAVCRDYIFSKSTNEVNESDKSLRKPLESPSPLLS